MQARQRLGHPTLHMLEVRPIGELFIETSGSAVRQALSAASGLVRVGKRVFVAADDENHLALFDLSSSAPGRLFRVFEGDLPPRHQARKAAKPDCEALLLLPAFAAYPNGALMVLGSGSRPSRQRAALIAFGAAGDLQGPARSVDFSPLFEALRELLPDLNIEGAFVQGDVLCLLQRGNRGSGVNARIDLSWPELQAWLTTAGPAPRPIAITPFELGALGGVPLSFTDGAALPGGGWVFSAAAEDTADSYSDGFCAGSAIGVVDASGAVRTLQPLSMRCKVEGVAASASGDTLDLLLVTDADDRAQPALLLSASLRQ